MNMPRRVPGFLAALLFAGFIPRAWADGNKKAPPLSGFSKGGGGVKTSVLPKVDTNIGIEGQNLGANYRVGPFDAQQYRNISGQQMPMDGRRGPGQKVNELQPGVAPLNVEEGLNPGPRIEGSPQQAVGSGLSDGTKGGTKDFNSVEPKRGASQVSGSLDRAVTEIKKVPDDDATVATFRAVFDAALRSNATVPGSGAQAVSGKVQEVSGKIAQTVGLANEASPHNAPGLYRSAIKTAEEAVVAGILASHVAKAVTQTIMGYALEKAKSSLNELAGGVSQAAVAGSSGEKEVERTIGSPEKKVQGSLDKWESLVGPIENLGRLKNFIRGVQAEAKAAHEEKASIKVSPPRISFERKGNSFIAKLPASSVLRLPRSLALGFAMEELGGFSSTLSGWSEAARAFRLDPSNGYKILRSEGVDYFRAGRYWVKATLRRRWEKELRNFRRRFGKPSALSPEELKRLSAGIDREYFSARGLLARTAAVPMRMTEVEALIVHASEMAKDYQRLSGDDSGVRSVARIGRRIRDEKLRLGLSNESQAPPRIVSLARAQVDTLAYWTERIHEAAADRLKELGTAPGNEAPASAAQTPSALSRSLGRLLLDVRRDPRMAREMVTEIQFLEPDPSRFETIGRMWVGPRELLAQSFERRLPDGRLARFLILREETGQFAYGRAESAAGARLLLPKTLTAIAR